MPQRPGGVRTFPLLALAGGGLFLLEPRYGAAFIAGLLVVGSWIYAYVRRELKGERPEGMFMVPVCNLLAYMLGPDRAHTAALGRRDRRRRGGAAIGRPSHAARLGAARLGAEVMTAAQFLILVGVVLPLLAGKPAIPYTSITPFGVWLAVVAVSIDLVRELSAAALRVPGARDVLDVDPRRTLLLDGDDRRAVAPRPRRGHDAGAAGRHRRGDGDDVPAHPARLFSLQRQLGADAARSARGLAIVSAVVAAICARLGTRSP